MAAHIRAILAAALAMAALGTLYKWGDIQNRFRRGLRTALKGMATAAAGALALYAGALGGGRYAWLTAAGLFVCALADMVLEKDLMAGAAVFAAGHLCYMAAFLTAGGLKPVSIFLYAVLAAALALSARAVGKTTKKPVLPFALYGGVLCLMLSLAWGHSWLAGLGATLFLISDGFIGYAEFVRPSTLNGIGCISLYYTAQFLLALTAMAAV